MLYSFVLTSVAFLLLWFFPAAMVMLRREGPNRFLDNKEKLMSVMYAKVWRTAAARHSRRATIAAQRAGFVARAQEIERREQIQETNQPISRVDRLGQ